ncbi:hypothetical protein BSKO_04303 [Bryopsis sp. KO-2023]|nr:hypothetical protein BSKO_04303 [Bryopsis sp. KO-2023]
MLRGILLLLNGKMENMTVFMAESALLISMEFVRGFDLRTSSAAMRTDLNEGRIAGRGRDFPSPRGYLFPGPVLNSEMRERGSLWTVNWEAILTSPKPTPESFAAAVLVQQCWWRGLEEEGVCGSGEGGSVEEGSETGLGGKGREGEEAEEAGLKQREKNGARAKQRRAGNGQRRGRPDEDGERESEDETQRRATSAKKIKLQMTPEILK